MAPRHQPGLDRDRVIAAAFEQLEEDGLEALSMRRLAARLGVQAPALYWHFGDKAELLGLMSARIYAMALAETQGAIDWRGWLVAYGEALRRSFAAHRDGALLCARARPPQAIEPEVQAARLAAPLVAFGLDQARALSAQAAVIAFALGWAMYAANGPMRDHLAQMLDFDAAFAQGLAALVRGL
jgi:TetR/AcrR family transcriptional regulator, tetracycline repressor protein